jgi:hypothetical protein
MSIYRLEFITPLFSRGAYDDRPEIRPASIRGQLHWWFRALGGNYNDEKAIFGSVLNGALASKIVVRIGNVLGPTGKMATLPHKPGDKASPKACYLPGTTFELHVLSRLGGLDHDREVSFHRTLKAWLFLGVLGLRATRAGGSFCWEPLCDTALVYPVNWSDFEQQCAMLIRGSLLRFALLGEIYENADAARRIVSDTLGGPDQSGDFDDLRDLHWPLGDVASKRQQQDDSTRKDRKTSPLRFRIVKIQNQYRIAALWDARDQVTQNNTQTDLSGVIRLLAEKKPVLGQQLAMSTLAR